MHTRTNGRTIGRVIFLIAAESRNGHLALGGIDPYCLADRRMTGSKKVFYTHNIFS